MIPLVVGRKVVVGAMDMNVLEATWDFELLAMF